MQRLVAVGLFGLLAWAAWRLYRPVWVLVSEPQSVASSQMRQVGGTAISGLSIAGWVEENRVPPKGRLRAWYRIANVGPEPIQDLKLFLHGSGFGLPTVRGCGAQGGVVSSGGAALAEIKPTASCALEVETGATAEAGEYMLTAAFSWSGPQRATRFEVLELGPLRVRSQQRERVAGLLGLIVQLAPIFVPVSVVLLGFWFQQRQQKLVHERQAWAAMLPVSHENNSNLYLPLLSAIRSFRKNLHTREGFFYLLLTIRLMREVSGKGGFYLKDRKGESLVSDLWSAFLKSLRKTFVPIETLQAAVDAVQPGDSFSRFERKLTRLPAPTTKMPELEKSFSSWCLEEGKTSLFLFHGVLHHEMNRIYSFWYGREQVLEPEQVRELREQVDESDLEDALKKSLNGWVDHRRSWRAVWWELKEPKRRKRKETEAQQTTAKAGVEPEQGKTATVEQSAKTKARGEG